MTYHFVNSTNSYPTTLFESWCHFSALTVTSRIKTQSDAVRKQKVPITFISIELAGTGDMLYVVCRWCDVMRCGRIEQKHRDSLHC